MKKLLKNKKGFTLIEMLIVVAIIVILVAISIPTFSANLDNAKEATDNANLRAAKSAAITAYAMDSTSISSGDYYDIEDGKFTSTEPAAYGESSANTGKVIKVTISATGEVTVDWADHS